MSPANAGKDVGKTGTSPRCVQNRKHVGAGQESLQPEQHLFLVRELTCLVLCVVFIANNVVKLCLGTSSMLIILACFFCSLCCILDQVVITNTVF